MAGGACCQAVCPPVWQCGESKLIVGLVLLLFVVNDRTACSILFEQLHCGADEPLNSWLCHKAPWIEALDHADDGNSVENI